MSVWVYTNNKAGEMIDYTCRVCGQFPDECNCRVPRKQERMQDTYATFQREIEQYISKLKTAFDTLEKRRCNGPFSMLEWGNQQSIRDIHNDLKAIITRNFFSEPADIKQNPAYRQGQADTLAQLNAWTQEQIRKAQK